MDIIALVIGFAIGAVVVSLAFEIGMKKTNQAQPASKPTKSWSINEVTNPRVMAEFFSSDVELPKNSKVLVNQYKNKEMFAGINARENKEIKGNYIIGDDRVLILSGPVRKDEVGIWTVEKEIVDKLNQDFEEMWSEGSKIQQETKTK